MTNVVNAAPTTAPQFTSPELAGEITVAAYRSYIEAQNAVDHLSDEGFPVQSASIVGHGLTSVEQVTGRMTKGRAALAGGATGGWLGLLLGVLLGVFTPGLVWLSVLLTSTIMGALWGAAIGFVAHWATRGRRDFTSLHGLSAERYDVVVRSESAAEAARLLSARQDR
jgi:hypothetical protein